MKKNANTAGCRVSCLRHQQRWMGFTGIFHVCHFHRSSMERGCPPFEAAASVVWLERFSNMFGLPRSSSTNDKRKSMQIWPSFLLVPFPWCWWLLEVASNLVRDSRGNKRGKKPPYPSRTPRSHHSYLSTNVQQSLLLEGEIFIRS